ncbi:MAG: autotransporter domain-containing protein [Rhodopseudomonas sp.]|uniref:autotransporter outer membrane beta-barrel domain-containing protein n=1 Tax=Rhodopseudomonas sp. TaxID=1078 RepID=UPI0039E37A01
MRVRGIGELRSRATVRAVRARRRILLSSLLASTALVAITMPALAQQVWVGADQLYNTPSNWSGPATVPDTGNTAVFRNNGASTSLVLSGNTTRNPDGFTFEAGAPGFLIGVLSGAQLNFNGAGIVNNSGTSQQLIIDSSSQIDFRGSSTAADVKITNTGGTLLFSQTSSGGTAEVVSNGGNLALRTTSGAISIGSLSGSGTVQATAAGVPVQSLTVGSLNTSTEFSGTFVDNGAKFALGKTGTGTLTLTGDSFYTGGTTISSGTLQLGNGGISGSITGDITNNATLTVNRSNSTSLGGAISGTGQLIKLGGAILALLGDNTYTGGTTISAGTLRVGNGATGGSIVGDVVNNGVLEFNRFDSIGFNGVISGTGSVTKLGNNSMLLGGDNTYTGGTTISGGYLQIGTGGTTGSIVGDVVNNGTLEFARSDAHTFSGAISGGGSLIKRGAGNLSLTGTSSYTGATTVEAGTLSVNGSIAASSLTTVNAGAALGGNGTVGTTLINGGALAPGNSIGTLNVSGNLTFTAASSYMVEVSPSSADRVNVSGTATLGGATVNASFASGGYVERQYTIVNATGGVVGTFGTLVNTNLPSGFRSSLGYDSNNAYLNLVLDYTPSPDINSGLNRNQTEVASALSGYFARTGSIPLVFGALTPAGLSIASGETTTGAQQSTVNAMTQFMGVLTDPSSNGRGARDAAPGPLGYADRTPHGSAFDAYAMITKSAAAQFVPHWNVWGAGFGGAQTTDGNASLGSSTATSRLAGIAAGADYWLSPQTVAGFAMAGGATQFGLAGGLGSGTSDLIQVGGFIRHSFGASYLTAAAAYGWQDITTERTVAIGGLNQLRANFNANAYSVRVEAGHRWVAPVIGGLGVSPYAAAQVTAFDLPAYAEQAAGGTGVFALGYAAKTVAATRSELGVRTDKSFALDGALLTLRGRAAWAHDFDVERSITATFQALPGASFVVNGARPARDAALTTVSAEVSWLNGFSVGASFEGEFSDVTRSYAGKGLLRYAW